MKTNRETNILYVEGKISSDKVYRVLSKTEWPKEFLMKDNE